MMKKRLIFTLLLAAFIVACFAQKPYKVMFYNLENFFDTINDPEVLDDEFTPEGPKQWNSAKYNRKLGNTERVLFDLAAADKVYPAVIGVSEVENRSVLEDIVAAPKLAPADYRIVHARGARRRRGFSLPPRSLQTGGQLSGENRRAVAP